MENKIDQIALQVSHLSGPQGHLPGQPKFNPSGHINMVSVHGEELVEGPVTAIQESAPVPTPRRMEERKEGESLPPVLPLQPPPPFPLRVAWSKLSKLKPFARFLELLRKIYVNIPFLEALKQTPS